MVLMRFFKFLIFRVKNPWAAWKVDCPFHSLSHLVKNLPEIRQAAKIAKDKRFTNVGRTPVPLQSRRGIGIPLGEKARGNHCWLTETGGGTKQWLWLNHGIDCKGKFLLPKDTLHLWSAPLSNILFSAKKITISPRCSVDLSVYEQSLLLVLAQLKEPSY